MKTLKYKDVSGQKRVVQSSFDKIRKIETIKDLTEKYLNDLQQAEATAKETLARLDAFLQGNGDTEDKEIKLDEKRLAAIFGSAIDDIDRDQQQ